MGLRKNTNPETLLEKFKTAPNRKFKQTNFFEKIDGKDMIITLEIRVPYIDYEGYQIETVKDLDEYNDHIIYWFYDYGKIKGVKFE